MNNSDYEIVNNFKRTYKKLFGCMTHYHRLTDYDMIVELDDGTRALYDDFDKTYRMLPNDICDPSKESYGIEFGKRLTSLMDRKGATQYELARRIGISQSSMSGYISGRRIPSIYILNKIHRTLQCTEDEIRYLDMTL